MTEYTNEQVRALVEAASAVLSVDPHDSLATAKRRNLLRVALEPFKQAVQQ